MTCTFYLKGFYLIFGAVSGGSEDPMATLYGQFKTIVVASRIHCYFVFVCVCADSNPDFKIYMHFFDVCVLQL